MADNSLVHALGHKLFLAVLRNDPDCAYAEQLMGWAAPQFGGHGLDHYGTAKLLFRKLLDDGREPEWIATAALQDIAALVVDEDGLPKGPQWDAETEARNKWVYDHCMKLTPYKTIIAQLAKRTEWEPLATIPSVKRAAKAYAQRHKLPAPPARQSGRPSNR